MSLKWLLVTMCAVVLAVGALPRFQTLVEVLDASAESPASLHKCAGGEFFCVKGNKKMSLGVKCIPASFRCDGAADCDYAEDEEGCDATSATPSTTKCGAETHFTCALDGNCIDRANVCDGVRDCADGEDERACATDATPTSSTAPSTTLSPCASNEFHCDVEQRCIPAVWQCDGFNDCQNGSDEEAALCQKDDVGGDRAEGGDDTDSQAEPTDRSAGDATEATPVAAVKSRIADALPVHHQPISAPVRAHGFKIAHSTPPHDETARPLRVEEIGDSDVADVDDYQSPTHQKEQIDSDFMSEIRGDDGKNLPAALSENFKRFLEMLQQKSESGDKKTIFGGFWFAQ